jgi:hypothetical protein
MVTRAAMRIEENGEIGAGGEDVVGAADAEMAGMAGMAGSEEATDTSDPAVRLSPRRGLSETITVRLQDTSRLFCPGNRFLNTADEAAGQSRAAA